MFDEHNAHTDEPRIDAGGKPTDPAIASAEDPFGAVHQNPAPSGEPPSEPESSAPESATGSESPSQEEAVSSGETMPTDSLAESDAASATKHETELPPAETEAGDVSDQEPPEAEPVASADASDEQEPVDEDLGEDEGDIEPVEDAEPIESVEAADEDLSMDWYILKVQSNREDSIREGLRRRIAVEGMERFFGDIIVPTEKVTEFKNGKKRVVNRKLYPGYIVVHMAINDDTWFLVRDTPGIGDFTGAAGKPIPMQSHEIARLLQKQEEKTEEAPKLSISFNVGDRIKINEGTFQNFEGEVEEIDEANGRVTVMINIFGRSTPVELEYWQIESV